MPNPNNGNFVLQQLLADDDLVKLEVWDELGRGLIAESVIFTANQYTVKAINLNPGVYLLKITDSRNNKYRIKFVVR
jgi:hypothetical protein